MTYKKAIEVLNDSRPIHTNASLKIALDLAIKTMQEADDRAKDAMEWLGVMRNGFKKEEK